MTPRRFFAALILAGAAAVVLGLAIVSPTLALVAGGGGAVGLGILGLRSAS